MKLKKIPVLLLLCLIVLTGCSSPEPYKTKSEQEAEKQNRTFTGFFVSDEVGENDSYKGTYSDYIEFRDDHTFFRQIGGYIHKKGTYELADKVDYEDDEKDTNNEVNTGDGNEIIRVYAEGYEDKFEVFIGSENSLMYFPKGYDEDNLSLKKTFMWHRVDSSQIEYVESDD